MAKITITKAELKALFGGQDVILKDEEAVYVNPLDVKQKLGVPNNLELVIEDDPIEVEEVMETEEPNPFEE